MYLPSSSSPSSSPSTGIKLILAVLAVMTPITNSKPIKIDNENVNNNNNNNEKIRRNYIRGGVDVVGDRRRLDSDDVNNNNNNNNHQQQFVYILSIETINFDEHEIRAQNCGLGHLASITTTEEYDLVKSIVINNSEEFDDDDNVWIGGQQDMWSRNDDGIERPAKVVWEWSDGSNYWFDDNGSYWEPGQPDNKLDYDYSIREMQGQHYVMMDSNNGRYIDEYGNGDLAPLSPAVYILPENYMEYDSCDTTKFRQSTVVPLPEERPSNPTTTTTTATSSPTSPPTSSPTSPPTSSPTSPPTLAPTLEPTS